MNIGMRIKQRRKELGMSAEDVAAAIGVSPASIYRYESGDIASPSSYVLNDLAKTLLTTPLYLIGWDDDPTPDMPDPATEDDIKVALFGGDKEVTDEMWEDVMNFVEFIKAKQKRGKRDGKP